MRTSHLFGVLIPCAGLAAVAMAGEPGPAAKYYVDVHELGAGNVTAEAVAEAHVADLRTQDEFGVQFLKYWVDEAEGRVYCLSESPSSDAVVQTHRKAHGLLPDSIHEVTEGQEAAPRGASRYYLDVHRLGPGAVTAEAVAEAHEADLATQDRYSVNFLNYWVDETEGLVWCLAEAPNAAAMSRTHEQAHGLVPDEIMEVVQGE